MKNSKPLSKKAIPVLIPGEHAAHALYLINNFGWLRAIELGRFIYPKDKHSAKYAQKLIRKLISLRFILQRKLPGLAGSAYVTASRGAAWLNEHATCERRYTDNTDWGRTVDAVWQPPGSWLHDLYAVGVLSLFHQAGDKVIPEAELRRFNPVAEKHPDGLIIESESAVWLEVENSRKSGENLEKTIRALARASRSDSVTTYGGISISGGMIAIPFESRDERGHKVNHLARIENKIESLRVSKGFVLLICTMHIRGFTVERIELEERYFEATV